MSAVFGMILQPYVIFPTLVILIGFKVLKEKHMKLFLFGLACLMGVLSFHITDIREGYDLFSHYRTLDLFRALGPAYFAEFSKTESLPLFALYFYLVSLLPKNEFLPAITAFLVYGVNFFMAYKVYRRFSLSKRTLMILTIFLMCNLNYAGIVSGIRFNLAASVAILALYYDFFEGRKLISACLIAVSAMLHSSIILILLVRILLIPCTKKSAKLYVIISAGIVAIILSQLKSILGLFSFNNPFLAEFLFKTDLYLQNEEQGAFWTTSYYALLFMFFILILYIAYQRFYDASSDDGGMVKLFTFQVIMAIMTVGFFNNYVVLGRLIIFMNLLTLPYLGTMMKNDLPDTSLRVITKVEAAVLAESLIRLMYYLTLGGYYIIHLSL